MGRVPQFNPDELTPFARWVYENMRRGAWTNRTLAEAVGVERSFFDRLLNSHREKYRQYRRPPYATVRAIGQALGDVTGALEAAGYADARTAPEDARQPADPRDAQIDALCARVAELEQQLARAHERYRRLRDLPRSAAETEARRRQRAVDTQIDGPHVRLAREVRRLMGHDPASERPYLSLRRAAGKTGLSPSTVSLLVRGHLPSQEMIRRFATGLGEDGDGLVRLAAGP